MSAELKECPWCGKEPNIGPWGAQDLNAWPGATAIECSSDLHDCPVNPSVTGYTRAEAITTWNTRHGAGDAEDSARLDWLISQIRLMDLFNITYPHNPGIGDARAAIDAARAGERE